MREVVTLQLGHLSNFVATHFWNAQESYFTYTKDEVSPVDHDVHWRPGLASDGTDTFLPRAVIYDLKGGFGSLRKINALYDPTEEKDAAVSSSLWSGQSVVHKQTAIQQSAYQQSLDAGSQPPRLTKSAVRYWSDFSRTFYHPRSLTQLYDFELNSSIRPFDRFDAGSELFDTLDKEEDLVDRDLRPFVEECDRMQGLQLFATLDDAWGGFAGRYLASLRDEYPKSCLWLWGLTAPADQVTRDKRLLRMANTARSVADASSLASMVVPVSLPERRLLPPGDKIGVDPASPWHVSGAMATAIESSLLPTRLAARSGLQAPSMWDIVDGLNTTGTQIVARLRMTVGNAAVSNDNRNSEDQKNQGEEAEAHAQVDFFALGQMKGPLLPRPQKSRIFGRLSCIRGSSVSEDLEPLRERGRRLPGDPIVQNHESSLKFPLLDSFPAIYTDHQDATGLCVRTTLSTETSQVAHLKAMRAQSTMSVAMDEREVLSSSLADIADAYKDDWDSGSDEDDDDL